MPGLEKRKTPRAQVRSLNTPSYLPLNAPVEEVNAKPLGSWKLANSENKTRERKLLRRKTNSPSLKHVLKLPRRSFLAPSRRTRVAAGKTSLKLIHVKQIGERHFLTKKTACGSPEDVTKANTGQQILGNIIFGRNKGACGSRQDLTKANTCQIILNYICCPKEAPVASGTSSPRITKSQERHF